MVEILRASPSAHVAVSALVVCMAGALLIVALGLSILVLGDNAKPFLWLGPVFVVVDGLGLAVSTFLISRAVDRETKAGYTTLRFGYRQFDEIDVKSGAVIRPAGSRRITLAERRRRVALARTVASESEL